METLHFCYTQQYKNIVKHLYKELKQEKLSVEHYLNMSVKLVRNVVYKMIQ